MLHHRWLLTCAALLASAAGCSGGGGGTETKLVLYPVAGKGGVITYRAEDPHDPALEEQRRAALWERQRRDELNQVRQENLRAESLRRQSRGEQFRQEQRALQAYQDARLANDRANLLRRLDRQHGEVVRPPSARSDSSPGAEANRLERESRALDDVLRKAQQEQDRSNQQRQH